MSSTAPAVYETRTVNNIALYKDTTTNKYYDLVSYQRGTRVWIMREVPSSAFNTVWDQSGPTVSREYPRPRYRLQFYGPVPQSRRLPLFGQG